MNEPEEPRRRRPIDVRPQPLDYRGPNMEPSQSRMTGGQIAAGFAWCVASVGAAIGVGVATQSGSIGFATLLLIFIPGTAYFGNRVGWHGFMPGILIGMAFTCLVPVGILAVLCAGK